AHSARLHGRIDPNGWATGATQSGQFVVTNLASPYDQHTYATPPVADKTTPLAFTLTITGLNPAATYGYQLQVPGPNGMASQTTLDTLTTTDLASKVVFTSSPPASIQAGTTFSATATTQDASGNVVNDFAGTVAVELTTAGSATLSGTLVQPVVHGVASFTDLSVDKTDSYTLTPSATPALTASLSGSFTITPGPLDHIAVDPIATQTAGMLFSVQATAYDAFSNIKVDYPGGASVTGSTLGAPNTAPQGCGGSCPPSYGAFGTWTNGVASANVTLYVAETNRSLTVADGAHAGTSNAFTVSAAALDHISFSQQPGGSPTGGVAFPTQPMVLAQDIYDNGVSATNVALSITPSTGTSGAALSCPSTTSNTLATSSSGTAAFTDCAIDKAGTAYQLRAAAGSLQLDSSSFNVAVGPPAIVSFSQQPGGSPTGGVAFPTQPSVLVTDAGGNAVSATNVALTITPLTGTSGAALSCPSTTLNTVATNGSGLSAFSDCAIDKAGTGYQLRATAGGVAKDSATFDVTVGPAAKLVFTTEPSSAATHGVVFAQQPVVSVEDAGGNVVITDSTTVVTLGLAGGASGAALTCTTPPHVINGVATFDGCFIDTPSATPYQVTASGSTSGTAGPFSSTDVLVS
ncbi:MAG TPA: hypothetical protein VN895_06635, partial [Candidatus Acidoferrum sp.]|nr:hypothetical protein [Candidatus Acidoferrum sp.]